MSVTMSRTDGVTVFTVTSDPQSRWPPLFQILKTLCYSPVCCSVSQHLRTVQRTSLSVLGTIQIIVGLLNIGLGVILRLSRVGSSWEMDVTGFPFWLGALFIVFGITCILSERFSSPCLVIFNVILNLAGVAFAIAGIVLYSVNLATIYWWGMCNNYDYDYSYNRHRATPSPEEIHMKEKCLEVRELLLMLLRSINAVLIVLSALEFCVTISSAVLGIKALKRTEEKPNKSSEDPELYKPLMEEVSTKIAI
ncbi:membrane-spanning 4-domains subfamily A member 8-like [Melanotaenia boesemani]|uniref:membrane-spanning 4-domains subfamily A member 8-like n=1 Tax=Melanotaenia boesemani TaxID=1250792 RepID=UPI001C0528E6|nr:membrane-spanning 4-domains subfamily A member 8-like [Melanotaenia boesemani]XP_041843313.1 membrane-spanning 4-domains subfamily A member 8-like [Melanotaenia boesemani]